jgi:hypothetical protein
MLLESDEDGVPKPHGLRTASGPANETAIAKRLGNRQFPGWQLNGEVADPAISSASELSWGRAALPSVWYMDNKIQIL